MCRAAVSCQQPLCFCHGELCLEEVCVVEVLQAAESSFAVEHLSRVVRRVHLLSVFQRGDGELFDFFHRQVEVSPVVSVVCMSVVLYLVNLVVFVSRVVHHHEVSVVKVCRSAFFGEREGRVGLLLSHRFPFGIDMCVSELPDGLSVGHAEHSVYVLQHGGLLFFYYVSLFPVRHHFA